MTRLHYLTISMALALSTPLWAVPVEFSYGGRLADASNNPLPGPVYLQVTFYNAQTGGTAINPPGTLTFANVPLNRGQFDIKLGLTLSQLHAIFADNSNPVWVDVDYSTDGGGSYVIDLPRQRFTVVPYALKVPVDDDTVFYNSSGQLVADLPRVVVARAKTSNTIPTGTVVFESEDYDSAGAYNPGNGRFTAPISGYYRVSINVHINSAGSWGMNMDLYRNGSRFSRVAQGGDDVMQSGTDIIYLNAGDYVFWYNSSGQTGPLQPCVPVSSCNYFSIELIN